MNRVREWRQRRGLTLDQLAQAIGTSGQQISRLEKGERRLTLDWRVKLAHALAIEADALLAATAVGPGRPFSVAGDRIPVLGAARGGVSQEMHLDDPIDWTQRPALLRDVRDAYAIYVVGDSMAPRFRAGTLLFVNPFKPPRRDNGVVVQLDDRAVLIKDFVGWAEDRLDLVQYNPAGPVEVPRARVLAVHTVVGTQES